LCFSGFLGFLVFSFPSGFSGLAITWLTHYCWSCDRNSVHWLMFDIILHLVTDQVSGDVIGGGQYDACWCWTYLNMYITVTVIEITPQYFAWSYFFVSLGFGFLFLMLLLIGSCYEFRSELIITLLWGHLSLLFRLT
jgi:hypothetical protein